MALSISFSKLLHRFDSTAKPVFTASGYSNSPRWYFKGYKYLVGSGSPYTFTPLNRTDKILVELRDAITGGWNLSNASFAGQNLTTTAGGFCGAKAGGPFSNVSIEGNPTDISSQIVFLGLQAESTYTFNHTVSAFHHCLLFSPNGIGEIWEAGLKVQSFIWELGDKGLLEKIDGIIKYWLIKSNGDMKLIRSVRSLFTGDVAIIAGASTNNSTINNIYIWLGDKTSVNLETFGVLDSSYQDWQNQAVWESLAEKTMNKDKRETFTYFTRLKQLKTLSLELEWREESEYLAFLSFFNWHDLDKDFIFIDTARNTAQKEMFVKFVSGFKDSPLGGALYGISIDIRQSLYRNTFVIPEV